MKLGVACAILSTVVSVFAGPVARRDVEGAALTARSDSHEGIVNLNSKTFNKESMTGLWYVKFFSPYCAKCKEAAPKWEAAFDKYGGNDEALTWAEVDCAAEGDLCGQEKVKRYPQIQVYQDGKMVGEFEYSFEQEDFYLFARLLQKFGSAGVSESLKDMKEIVDKEDKLNGKTSADADKIKQEAHEKNLDSNVMADMTEVLENTLAVLTPKDWNPTRLNKLWFIKFHDPHSSASKDLVPRWKQAFKDLGGIFGTWGMGMAWGEVDCGKTPDLCKKLEVTEFPSLRVYLDTELIHKYDGPTEPDDLKIFAKKAIAEWAPKDDEGNLLEITISRGDDSADEGDKEATSPPKISDSTLEDAINYALNTGGKRVDSDPGLLVFGKDAQAQHNIRTFREYAAPPPSWENIAASHSKGESVVLTPDNYNSLLEESGEPWFVKFYSPLCPHCAALAPEWAKLAKQTAGKVNVAEVNCQDYLDLCLSMGVSGFPTIRFYSEGKLQPDYVGSRDASAMEMYVLMQTGGQIIPVDSLEEVWGNVTTNNGEGRASFIYLYDKSVMSEDWEALSAFAARMAPLNGVVYRTDNRDVIEELGIHHHGSTLSFLGVDEPSEESMIKYSIPYRLSNVPLKLRDPKLLEKWAHKTMFASAQPLEVSQVTFMNKLAPAHAVFLLPAGSGNLPEETTTAIYGLRRLAHAMYEESDQLRVRTENTLRIERLAAHDAAVEKGDYKLARKVAKSVIDVPLGLNVTFSFLPLDRWQEDFGAYFDVSNHVPGQVIVFDPYNKRYVDEIGGSIIKGADRDGVSAAADYLRDYAVSKSPQVKKASKAFKDVEPFKAVARLDFEKMSDEAATAITFLSFKLVVLVAISVVLFGSYRVFLRRGAARHRSRSRSGILTGKLD